MSETVWDASALLAVLNAEPGWEGISDGIGEAILSAVNLSEVASRLIERGMPGERARGILDGLALDVRAFDRDTAYRTAALRPATRALGLSLGDRACLALASQLGCPALTADRRWLDLQLDVEIRLVR